jgi:hypothetical protein
LRGSCNPGYGWPMTAAIFALIGVVIGGLLSYFLDLQRERRRSRVELLTACRLLQGDMAIASTFAGVAVETKTGIARPAELSPEWREHQRVVAANLSDLAEWQLVLRGFMALAFIDAGFFPGLKLDTVKLENLGSMIESLDTAGKVLMEYQRRPRSWLDRVRSGVRRSDEE